MLRAWISVNSSTTKTPPTSTKPPPPEQPSSSNPVSCRSAPTRRANSGNTSAQISVRIVASTSNLRSYRERRRPCASSISSTGETGEDDHAEIETTHNVILPEDLEERNRTKPAAAAVGLESLISQLQRPRPGPSGLDLNRIHLRSTTSSTASAQNATYASSMTFDTPWSLRNFVERHPMWH